MKGDLDSSGESTRRVEARRLRRTITVLGAGVALLLSAGEAPAQTFGRWWWTGFLGGSQQGYRNEVGGAKASSFDERQVRLSLGVNGFVVHPSLARFRLGVDAVTSQYVNGRSLDSDQLGYDGEIEILPQGRYPLRLFARRQQYDFQGTTLADPFAVLTLPDTITTAGGRLRVRSGWARGLVVGANHTETEFLGRGAAAESQDRQFLDWARSGRRLQHHVRFERSRRDYSSLAMTLDDLTFSFDELGSLPGDWRWEMSAVGLRREVDLARGGGLTTDDLRLLNRFQRRLRERDQVEIRYESDYASTVEVASSSSQLLGVVYRWLPRTGVELTPFVEYGMRSGENDSLSAPRLGVRCSWSERRQAWNTLLSLQGGYGKARVEREGESRDESLASYAVAGAIGHGGDSGWREEVEASWSRNDLTVTGRAVTDLPDLGITGLGLALEDQFRGRVKLDGRWGERHVAAWGEWNRRSSSGDLQPSDLRSETLSTTLQAGARWWSVTADAGETRVSRLAAPDQQIRFLGVALFWRPIRSLELQASYRSDLRDFAFLSDLEGERLEAAGALRVGMVEIEGRLFRTSERLTSGLERTNNGFRWSVGRRFAGWLPIVTATPRRGVIR